MITIIVPVYNVEKYLRRCLDSILNQTYTDLEIILINDGSTDSSREICSEYEEKDKRIKFIDKDNKGVSSARNDGLKYANGDYILFVDSDDMLYKNALDIVAKDIETYEDVELICYSHIIMSNYKKENNNMEDIYLEDKEIVLAKATNKISGYPWGKLFKTNIIKEKNINFDEKIKYMEDAIFIINYLKYCKKVYINHEVIYEYNQSNENSANSKKYWDFYKYAIKYDESMQSLMKEVHVDELTKGNAERAYIPNIMDLCSWNYSVALKDKLLTNSDIKNGFDKYITYFNKRMDFSEYKNNFGLLKGTLIYYGKSRTIYYLTMIKSIIGIKGK